MLLILTWRLVFLSSRFPVTTSFTISVIIGHCLSTSVAKLSKYISPIISSRSSSSFKLHIPMFWSCCKVVSSFWSLSLCSSFKLTLPFTESRSFKAPQMTRDLSASLLLTSFSDVSIPKHSIFLFQINLFQ